MSRDCRHNTRNATFAVAIVGAFLALLAWSARSEAAYEQVGTFGGVLSAPVPPAQFPESAQMGGVMGMATNNTGAGGVPIGTLYVASAPGINYQGVRISRFSPQGVFELAWTPSERCGPQAGGTTCTPRGDGTGKSALGLDIDQETGNVYVYRNENQGTGTKAITEYTPDGSQVLAEFGEIATTSISESPEKIHGTFGEPDDIAVGGNGKVFVFDADGSGEFRSRLMIFEPETPGDITHYKYAGEATGAPHGPSVAHLATRPVFDDQGHVFIATEEFIGEYNPTAATATPICSFTIKNGAGRGMTVDPQSGTIFYYDYTRKRMHVLDGTCGPNGQFAEIESFALIPPRGYPQALAFDPNVSWKVGESPGVLYVAAPNSVGDAGGGEPGAGGIGYAYANHVTAPPVAEVGAVTNTTTTTTAFHGNVEPNGLSTSYLFQYETQAAFEANDPAEPFAGALEVPVGGRVIPNLQGSIKVSAVATGLQADTAYRFRLVASNLKGTVASGPEAFSTYPEVLAPADGRGYELVSPADKDGGEVYPAYPEHGSCPGICKPGEALEAFPAQSSPDGSAVGYEGSAFGFGVGALQENQYVATRTSSGWQTTLLSPLQQSSGLGSGFRALNAALSVGIVNQGPQSLSPTAPAGYPNLYISSSGSPSVFSPLLTQAPPNRPAGESLTLSYAGASADLSRIFFTANDALTGPTAWAPSAEDGGALKANLYEWHANELRLVNVLPGNESAPAGAFFGGGQTLTHAVSADGSRAFWSSESGQVFVREDGERTREIATVGVPDPGKFVTASADGSQVLLANGNLHELDGQEGTVDLTQGRGGFLGILGGSEDLTHVYFVDTAVLTAGEENQNQETAEPGTNNLYAWINGNTSFVARLNPEDLGDWTAPSQSMKTAKASPDGRWLTFQSRAKLTPYQNAGFSEVYLFDSAEARLRCVSCNPTGEVPVGGSRVPSRAALPAKALPQMNYLTDSGRLFFDSQDRLSVADSNGRSEDVYEYEPAGLGSCTRGDGCVNLISSGKSPTDSNFLAASDSGDDVFFTTRAQLVPADKDGLMDLYDARVGGGFPPPTGTGECSGEACQQGQEAPSLPAPTSSQIAPEGSSKPSVSCKKGQQKKKGRCVKKPKKHKKSKHAHAKHKAKHAKKNARGAK